MRILGLNPEKGGRAILRAELLKAMKKMQPQEIWLNRDSHRILTRGRARGVTQLRVMEENAWVEVAKAGRGAVTYTEYTIVPLASGVLRRVEGMRVPTSGPGSFTAAATGESRLGQLRQTVRLARDGWLTSLMVADPDDIRQVITWLDGAERHRRWESVSGQGFREG